VRKVHNFIIRGMKVKEYRSSYAQRKEKCRRGYKEKERRIKRQKETVRGDADSKGAAMGNVLPWQTGRGEKYSLYKGEITTTKNKRGEQNRSHTDTRTGQC